MGKTVLITGASSGIGLELARLFAHDGYDLVLAARNEEALDKIITELTSRFGCKARAISIDLSDHDAAASLYNEIRKHGMQIDILVNSAGFGDSADFIESDWEKARRMVELNIITLMQLCHIFGQDMKTRGFGRILNIASVAGLTAGPHAAVYYASKAFVLSFSQSLAEELRSANVSVTVLCPGPTATKFDQTANMHNTPAFSPRNTASPAEVAKAGYSALMHGKAIKYHGWLTYLSAFGSRLLPRAAMRKIIGYMNKAPS